MGCGRCERQRKGGRVLPRRTRGGRSGSSKEKKKGKGGSTYRYEEEQSKEGGGSNEKKAKTRRASRHRASRRCRWLRRAARRLRCAERERVGVDLVADNQRAKSRPKHGDNGGIGA